MSIAAPNEFRGFHELMQRLTPQYGAATVFDDFLDYAIASFTIDQSIPWDKNYSKSEMQIFWRMYFEYVQVMDKKLESMEWFDFFGIYYEAEITSKSGRKGAGQFFTPSSICDLMTLVNPSSEEGLLVNDPSCGSGRCLLSYHVQNPGNYYIAQDLDHTCTKMTICNFLVHGLQADVIWGNTLTMDYFDAWKVNQLLPYTGVPNVRKFNSKELDQLINQKISVQEESEPLNLMDFTATEVGK